MVLSAKSLKPWGAASAVLLAGGLLAVLAAGCEQHGMAKTGGRTSRSAARADTGEDSTRVQTVTVERKDLVRTVEMPGTVEGFQTADLYAKIGGYLAEISVDIGDEVQKGQELARLWVPEMQKELEQKQALLKQADADAEQAAAAIRQADAEVASAQAMLAEAKAERAEKEAQLQFRQAELQRIGDLVRDNAVSRKLLDETNFQHQAAQAALGTVEARIRTAEAQVAAAEANRAKSKADHQSAQARVDVAQANLDYAKTMLGYATVRAPFDGYVTKRWVDAGAFIQPGGNGGARPLLTVTRADVVRVFVEIPMNDVRFLQRGDRAVLDRVTALPGRTFEGEVTRFSPSLNAQTRLMRIEIDLQNADRELRPGYYGYVTVRLEERPQTPVIPSSALLSDGKQTYVYVVENGTAQKRPVSVSYQDGTLVGIGSGLSGGEQVVKAGGGQIADGQTVAATLAAK